MAEYDDIKEKVAELAKLRDRSGLKKLTFDQRIDILGDIYDGLLFLWKQTVIVGSSKGTSAISDQLMHARQEMETLSIKVKKSKYEGQATNEEVMEFFTSIMRDTNLSMTQRAKAAEDLAKILAMFVERKQIEGTLDVSGVKSGLQQVFENPDVASKVLELEQVIVKQLKSEADV